jgi:tetratricopeptide (TPR) repeat protein
MSPEQAAGELDRLGPTSDIYALGAILYTVLTGGPPFRDKELAPLLYKVSQGDFKPPREVNKRVDPALDAVCMKAMALKPEDRYQTADELAQDLEHWMADEPVSVYREPVMRRVIRWGRRHRTAVASAAALLITGLVSLGIYSELIRREKDRTTRFYGLARTAVDRMLTRLGEEGLADTPQMELVRREMLDEAGRFYQVLRKERGNERGASADVARAAVRLADVETLIGEDKDAEAHYGEGITGLAALQARDGSDRELRRDLSRAYHFRGLLLRKLNRLDDAERDLKEALRLREGLAKDPNAAPDDRRAHTETLYHLGALHARAGKTAVAREEYDRAIKAQETLAGSKEGTVDDRRRLGRYLNNLGKMLHAQVGSRGEALDLYRRALDVQEAVVKERPVVAFYRYELGKTNGNVFTLLDGGPEAEPYAKRETDLAGQLIKDFPRVPDYRHELAVSDNNVGAIYLDEQRYGESLKALDEAVTTADALVRDHGDRIDYQEALAIALFNRGRLAVENGHPEKAEPDLTRAVATLKPLITTKGAAPDDALYLGDALVNLGGSHKNLNRRDDALNDLTQAVAVLEPASRDHAENRRYASALAFALRSRADLLAFAGQHKPAEADLLEAVKILKPLVKAKDATAADSRDLGIVLYNLANLREKRDPSGALRDLDEAITYLEPLARAKPLRRDALNAFRKALFQRGIVRQSAGLLDQAEADYKSLCELVKPLAEGSEAVRDDDLIVLGQAYFNLSKVHSLLKRFDDAMEAVDASIRVHGRLGNTPGKSIPPLWLDLDQKAYLLDLKKNHVEKAGVLEQLPLLRPDDRDSYLRAARALAFCTFPSTLGGKPGDAAVKAQCRGFADRAMKVLQEAGRRDLIGPAELGQPLYNEMRGREDFKKLLDDLKSKARSRTDATRTAPFSVAVRDAGGR